MENNSFSGSLGRFLEQKQERVSCERWEETKERGTEGRKQKRRDAARYPAGAQLILVREAAPVPVQPSE